MFSRVRRAYDVVTATTASVLQLGSGFVVGPIGARPKRPVELYEFEACPFCRRVREALTALDLEAIIYPCPKGGRFRQDVRERGGREMFPFFVDPNADIEMYESADIVTYLYESYGAGKPPIMSRNPLAIATGSLASVSRGTRGMRVRPGREPEQMLEFYNFETSPYCRLVREVLCELEIPYHQRNVGKRSPSRDAFVKRSGKMMVPFLIDPNTKTEMFESASIIQYLQETYGA